MIADDRFWSKVDKTESCWVWTGAKNPAGYGVLRRWDETGGRNYLAHRYSLMQLGETIDGFVVDHICHNPACVRPEHLRACTNKQNHENLRGPNANNGSGILGVSWDSSRQKWRGTVKHHYKSHEKRFDTIEDAEAWVVATRLRLFTHNDRDRVA